MDLDQKYKRYYIDLLAGTLREIFLLSDAKATAEIEWLQTCRLVTKRCATWVQSALDRLTDGDCERFVVNPWDEDGVALDPFCVPMAVPLPPILHKKSPVDDDGVARRAALAELDDFRARVTAKLQACGLLFEALEPGRDEHNRYVWRLTARGPDGACKTVRCVVDDALCPYAEVIADRVVALSLRSCTKSPEEP